MSKFVSGDEYLTFDDVLIKPCFSSIGSRQITNLSSSIGTTDLNLPIFSSNMDTVTEYDMCLAMRLAGGMGVLHRFCSIDKNVSLSMNRSAAVSAGLGDDELKRAILLWKAGAELLFLDVAHGAMQSVINQLTLLHEHTELQVVVGNFASGESVKEFLCRTTYYPTAIKVGIGPGSACTTRIKTGVGVPQLSAILECVEAAGVIPVIADGGMRTPGDIAKALAAGARAVMLGGMLAGTDETPGEVEEYLGPGEFVFDSKKHKKYRGSASAESYKDQGKDDGWRTAEGESFLVPYKGPVHTILKDIEGGLRSALTYVGANNLAEFREKAKFIRISSSSKVENGAHGNK